MLNRTWTYRRLTGRKRTLSGYSQLWLAPDHVLLVKSTRFTEEYQRFALADIQAIVITALPGRPLVLQLAGVVGAIAWTLGLLAAGSAFGKGFFAVTGALALALVIVDIARGTLCRCYLHTAVSRELLEPMARLRAAHAFLAQLRPAIEAVQGSLAPERVAMLEQPGPPAGPGRPPGVPRTPGYMPEILFALFLADAVLVGIDQRLPRAGTSELLFTAFFAEIVLAVVALFRRGSRDPRRIAYAVIAVALVCMGWDAVSFVRSFAGWMSSVMEAARQKQTAPQPVFSWTSMHGAALFASGWRLTAGVIGLISAYFERAARGSR